MQQEALTLDDLIGKGIDLPSLPEIYIRVSEQLDDDMSTAEAIGRTVMNDPAISTRILNMVNSAYYGLPKQVASVAQSVALLGRERLRQMLIGSLLKGVFGHQDNPAFSMQEFWQHSIKTAIIAKRLAQELPGIEASDALFTAGLLHDVGKLVMYEKIPERMLAAEATMIRKRIDLVEAEQNEIGVDHVEVTVALMQYWRLPELLIECVSKHHQPTHEGDRKDETHLVYLANQLSKYVPPLDEQETADIVNDIENWEMSGLGLDIIASACQQADDQVFEVMESLGMVPMEISQD